MFPRSKTAPWWVLVTAFGWAATAMANPVLDWCELMLDAIRTDTTNPTLSSRNLAILGAATHDAVQSITRTHQPFLGFLETSPETDVDAAVVAAGHEVMLALYPSFRPRAESLFEAQRSALSDTPGVAMGLRLGREAAIRLLAARGTDGSNTEVPYIPSDAPGQWRRTPPFFRPPLTPHWRHVRTFCLPHLDPFLPHPPPALDSAEYAADLNEVKRLGGKTSTERTAEQSQIANFWSDFSYTAMPPGHWNEIAATLARDRALTVPDTARLMALVGIAQADAAIVCWEAKYRWNLWRPVTAIRRADEDENPATVADPEWDHFLVAPPFPAYTSGHSTFSAASAGVLTHFFGTDALAFTARSDSLPGVMRSFTSVSACADEVGISRIYGGIHFPIDNIEGKRSGALIGNYVSRNFLLATDSLPQLGLEDAAGGVPILRVHGPVGRLAILEFSTDLRNWAPVLTQAAVPGGFDAVAKLPEGTRVGYYRVSVNSRDTVSRSER